ncbi:MAG: tripartite tricarboxylate transporter substrate binding protein [Proteobacteria bacterium]|nr:tripartite tricarboxylate transporter substrate binding protein [Pseudomonadota bacterium]
MASLLAGEARAGDWPDHPVRVVVPYAPGGPLDLVSRLVSEKLGARFGRSFVVENKPGANGAIGVQSVMASPPDGYTLLLHGSAGVTIYQAVMRQPAFDTLRDLTPVSLIAYFDLILCTNPAMPFRTVKDFVDYARANPGKLSYGTAGVGAMNHVGMEWFKSLAGIDVVHVPYRGDAPAAADLTAGVLGVAFVSSNVAIPLIQAGKLRALAVPSRHRISVLPDVPTIDEAGCTGFDLQPWAAMYGPARLDKSIVASLDNALKQIVAAPDVAQRLAQLSMTPAATSSEELAMMIEKSITLWKDVATKAKIVIE